MPKQLIIPAAALVTLRKSALFMMHTQTQRINIHVCPQAHTHTHTHEIANHSSAPCVQSWNGKSESCFSLLGKLPPSQTSHEATDCVPQLLSDDSMLCHACAISAWVNCLAPGWPAAPSEIPPPYCWWHHLLPATPSAGDLVWVEGAEGCGALLFPCLKGLLSNRYHQHCRLNLRTFRNPKHVKHLATGIQWFIVLSRLLHICLLHSLDGNFWLRFEKWNVTQDVRKDQRSMFLVARWWEEYFCLSSECQRNYFVINQLKRVCGSDLEEFKGYRLEWKNVHCTTCNYVDGNVIHIVCFTSLLSTLFWLFYH